MRLRRLEPVLRRAFAGPCALPPGARVLVAVSGGADSTALLLALGNLAGELDLRLAAAHLHHGLRGAEADADLAFVRALCAGIDVPLVAARWDCRGRMRRLGLSGQDGLRVLRRRFLAAAARKVGAAAIATAHTADDQLETLLLRIARGAGLVGLGGMRARRGRWIKPLLEATRSDVEADLEARRQPWREDRSNRDPRYARSRVRHEVIPALLRVTEAGRATIRRRGAADARSGLARRASAAMREIDAAHRMVTRKSARILGRVSRIHRGEIALDSRRLASYPALLQRMVLRLLWNRPGRAGYDLTQRHLNALQSLIATTRGGSRVDLPEGWRAERDRGTLLFRRVAGAGSASGKAPVAGRTAR
jgi:tRNA(Ile)-lysidine synthase